MYNLPFTGNVATDITLNTDTPSGVPRLNFILAVNENAGKDNEKSHFLPFTAFGDTAENLSKTLTKGMRATFAARVSTHVKEVQVNGEDKNLTMVGFTVQNGGPDMSWATAVVTKNAKKGGAKSTASFPDEDAAPAAKSAPKAAASKPAAKTVVDDNDF